MKNGSNVITRYYPKNIIYQNILEFDVYISKVLEKCYFINIDTDSY